MSTISTYDITIDFNNWKQNKNQRIYSDKQIIILKAYELSLYHIRTNDIFYYVDMFEKLMIKQIEFDSLNKPYQKIRMEKIK